MGLIDGAGVAGAAVVLLDGASVIGDREGLLDGVAVGGVVSILLEEGEGVTPPTLRLLGGGVGRISAFETPVPGFHRGAVRTVRGGEV